MHYYKMFLVGSSRDLKLVSPLIDWDFTFCLLKYKVFLFLRC